MKETELAYAAGIVDGEGYIGVKKSKAYECQGRSTPGYHALVSVKMVDRAALALACLSKNCSFRASHAPTLS